MTPDVYVFGARSMDIDVIQEHQTNILIDTWDILALRPPS